MMMGPTKKKVITAGVVAFIIPVIISTVLFVNYDKKKTAEIEELKKQAEVVDRYVFARNMLAGEIITAEDVKIVKVKEESAPIDSFEGKTLNLANVVNRRMKINAEEKTIVAESMLTSEDPMPTIDERYQEYNMISLPSDLEVGDFVDVRIVMPTGEDYIVINGKEVERIGMTPESNSVFLKLTEEEILRMTAAILESYLNDGYKIYATKYIDPSSQLYDYKRVDFVEACEKAIEELIKEKNEIVVSLPTENIDGTLKEETQVEIREEVTEEDITDLEIAIRIGLTQDQVADIRHAIENEDGAVLALYNDKLVTTRKNMTNTYPVKENIVNVIKKNPNILQVIKDKYNIDALIEERASLLDFPLYTYDEYGELEFSESMQKVQENLNKEIENQKAERKEYLQSLILSEVE